MADDELYVVMDGPPGPGAVSGEERRKLIGDLRKQAVAVAEGSEVAQTTVDLLRAAASQIERISAQFVEVETADGDGRGPASTGAYWESYPENDNGLVRLGPFSPYRRPTAGEALVSAAKAVDALVTVDGPPFRMKGVGRLGPEAEGALLILHDCLTDVECEVAEPLTGLELPEVVRLGFVALAEEVRALREGLVPTPEPEQIDDRPRIPGA